MRLTASLILPGLLLIAGTAVSTERLPADNLLCYSLGKDSVLKPYRESLSTFIETRKASKVLYFFKFPDALERSFWSNEKGRILQRREQGFVDSRRWLPPEQRATPTPDALRKAAGAYRDRLAVQLNPRYRGDAKPMPVPFEFLGAKLYPATLAPYVMTQYNTEKVRAGYEARPSDMAALVSLELALIERDLGLLEESEKTIQGTVERLELLNIDFRKDAEFRKHLQESNNFDRPECVLLFLAGDAAARRGDPRLAEKYYSALIEGSPASPFASEAFCKLPRLADVDQERVKKLEDILIGTYPLIWGCRRDDLKLDASKVKWTISTLLRTVEPQKVARYENPVY